MNRIFKSFNFSVVDYKDAENLLNSMALKGYEFKGTGKGQIKGFAMFEKNNRAKNINYAIDIQCNLLENEKEKYYDFYKDLGWKNKDCFNNKLHIFEAEQGSAFPIYTDDLTELENLKEGMRSEGLYLKHGLLIIFFLFLIWLMFRWGGIGINRQVSYFIIIYFLLAISYMVTSIINRLFFSLRCRKCIDLKDLLSKNVLSKELRFWENVFNIGSFVFFPSVAIAGYCYEIWGIGLNGDGFSNSWNIIWLLICVVSVFVLLSSTYLLFLYPEKGKYKTLSFVGYFMYYLSIYEFFIKYLLT